MTTPAKIKDERIELRVSRATKVLLQRAAAAREKSVTEFVLDSGLAAAEEALAERGQFVLDDSRWKEFLAALDAPAKRKSRLKRLLDTPSVLE